MVRLRLPRRHCVPRHYDPRAVREPSIYGCNMVALPNKWLAVLAVALSGLSSCSTSLNDMDQPALTSVSDEQLCAAVVRARIAGSGSELVETEKDRRGLTCRAQLEERVSDCASLKILKPEPKPKYMPGPRGENAYLVTFHIQNSKNKPMDFSIVWRGRPAGFYTIPAGKSQQYSFVIGDLPAQDLRGNPTPTGGELRYCTVMRGYGG